MLSNSPWADRLINIFGKHSEECKFVKVPRNKLMFNVFSNVKDRVEPKFEIFAILTISCTICQKEFLMHTNRSNLNFILNNQYNHIVYKHFEMNHGLNINFPNLLDYIVINMIKKHRSFKEMIKSFNVIANEYLLMDRTIIICNNEYKIFDKKLSKYLKDICIQ